MNIVYWLIGRIFRGRPQGRRFDCNKVLIINLQGLGDLLMTTPLIHELKDKIVDVLVADEGKASFLKSNKDINDIIVLDGFKTRKDINGRYDLIFLSHGAGPKSGLFFLLLKAKAKASHLYNLAGAWTGFRADIIIKQTAKTHRVEENLKLLKYLGIKAPKHPHYIYPLSKKALMVAELFWKENGLGEDVIGIHPGGDKHNPEKRYPIDSYLSLLKNIRRRAVFFIGPDEKELGSYIKKRKRKDDVICVRSIEETAAIIKKCSCLIHSDSGLGHVASAVDRRTLTLVGPTNWHRTKPYGSLDKIIKSPNTHEPRERRMEQGFIDRSRTVVGRQLKEVDL